MKLLLGVGAAERTLCVTKYSRQGSGDPFLIFRSLGKTTPNFFLIGPPKTLDDFMSAASGARVSGIFYFRRGMNVLEFDPHSLKIE